MQIQFYRDDLNHPTVSGNKLHKLAPNIALAKHRGCETILSFGGAYSNHLHALAWACKEQGLSSVALVRGELHPELTPTLKDCQAWGMRLIPLQRKTYRALQETLLAMGGTCLAKELLPASKVVLPEPQLPHNTFVIPEGGSNLIAINAIADAYQTIFTQPQYKNITHAVCATGTGATLAGLYKAAPKHVTVMGIQAVAEGDATLNRIRGWLKDESPKPNLDNLSIVPGHLGGFAKTPTELLSFIDDYQVKHNIPLDPIYNGKVVFKLTQMAKAGEFAESDNVLVIHTGGLQGWR